MPEPHVECDNCFRPLLAIFDQAMLDCEKTTIFGLWPDLTLAFMNPGWFRFSQENRGEPVMSRSWTLGKSILKASSPIVRDFFKNNYRRVLEESRPWEHIYECSSDAVYRQYQMNVFPLGDAAGLLSVNSLRIERRQSDGLMPVDERRYRNEHGLLLQCCHCRRFQRADVSGVWDWVGPWIKEKPADISHGICKVCMGFYYSHIEADVDHPQPFSTGPD